MNSTTEQLEQQWQEICQGLHDPHIELDTETFAIVLSTYKSLRAAGHVFDPGVAALMAVLERQASDTLDCFEDDTSSDEDRDDDGCEYGAIGESDTYKYPALPGDGGTGMALAKVFALAATAIRHRERQAG